MMLHHQEQQRRLHEKLCRELGPVVLAALDDADVTEVILNPDGALWTESQCDGMRNTGERMSAIQAENLIGTVASMLGTVVNAASPIVEGELPLDGNRFEGILPPVAESPVFVIRKRPRLIYSLDDYITAGITRPAHVAVIRDAITTRANILIAGGTASGKTTLANALIREMVALGDPAERFVILEDTRELQCAAPNVVQLHTGDVADLTRLTRVTMRLRPDRIIVGEVRGAEALDMLQAMNTGHDGSLTTVHANSARDALARIETMVAMGATHLPERAIRQQIASAVQVVLQQTRLSDGSRRVTSVSEITGMEGEVISMQDIFEFRQRGLDQNGKWTYTLDNDSAKVQALAEGQIVVVAGFQGMSLDRNITTLGRGGSDLTATLLGRALGAAEIVLWKDVRGILTADPRLVTDARLIPQLHHLEAAEVAYYGAKVLHPRALIPMAGTRLVLRVRSFVDPSDPGTEVSARQGAPDHPVKALAIVRGQAVVTVAGKGMVGGKPTAYVCKGQTCGVPVTHPKGLGTALALG